MEEQVIQETVVTDPVDGGQPVETQEPAGGEVVTQPQDENVGAAIQKEVARREAKLREQLEKEYGEKYKDYDVAKKAASYLQKKSGISDLMSLGEELELADLREQAEQQKVPVEVMKRLNQLEEKAKKGDELEQQQQQQQYYRDFRNNLDAFAKEKGADADGLEAFMLEHKVPNMEIAYKAMRAEQLEKQLAEVAQKTEADTIRKLQNNAQSTPGALGAEGAEHNTGFSSLSREDQRRMIEEVKQGKRTSL